MVIHQEHLCVRCAGSTGHTLGVTRTWENQFVVSVITIFQDQNWFVLVRCVDASYQRALTGLAIPVKQLASKCESMNLTEKRCVAIKHGMPLSAENCSDRPTVNPAALLIQNCKRTTRITINHTLLNGSAIIAIESDTDSKCAK